ncbi:MAG: ABC transporter ATP-binding protein [Gammaproteobacteria bacterium]|nr:ABC transporter ATP-binding protein [Gammaproteobacteria bacterium]
MPLLSCNNLSWSIDDKVILDNINVQVKKGQFIGVIGPNGAGKSSLLRCLYRFIKPSKGEVTYQHHDIWQLTAKEYAQQVAVVLQHTPQQFQLSVYDVVSQGLIPHQINFKQTFSELFAGISHKTQQQICTALAQVGLTHKSEMPFEQLSGGEKQRAMIAKAIVQKSEVLIMDEPTSHLDVKYQIQIMELAKSLGTTTVVSFHDLNLASALCDEIWVLKDGKLVSSGTPDLVITEPMLSEVFDVCTHVKPHPQHQRPQVTYFYGYSSQTNIIDSEQGVSDAK